MTRLGLSYRPQVAWLLRTRPDLDFIDVIAENVRPMVRRGRRATVDGPLSRLRAEGRTLIPHGVGLGLGGAELPAPARLDHLCRVAEALDAPFVSEHVAFVRAGGREAGHLLPIARTPASLGVLIDNVRRAQAALPVPLVLENVASLFRWPEDELDEAAFFRALVEATGVGILFDAANAHANAVNHGESIEALLERFPLAAIRYVHMAGGVERGGLYHDTHAHALGEGPLSVLRALCRRLPPPAVVLERDGGFGDRASLEAELAAIGRVLAEARPAPAPVGRPLSPFGGHSFTSNQEGTAP